MMNRRILDQSAPTRGICVRRPISAVSGSSNCLGLGCRALWPHGAGLDRTLNPDAREDAAEWRRLDS